MTGLSMMTWLMQRFFFCFVCVVLLPTHGPVAPFYLSPAPLFPHRPGFAFRLEPRLLDRARLPDPAPLPHQRPAIEQGPRPR